MMIKVVGITGTLNSGKDVAATAFTDRGYVRLSFADPLKDVVHRIFKIPTEILWGDSSKRDTRTRKILQELGTDFARRYDADVWVKRTMERIRALGERETDPLGLLDFTYAPAKVVVPDVRFPNEAQALREEFDATLIRVYRPEASKGKEEDVVAHASETSVEKIPKKLYTYTLRNYGTLDEFKLEAKNLAELIDA